MPTFLHIIKLLTGRKTLALAKSSGAHAVVTRAASRVARRQRRRRSDGTKTLAARKGTAFKSIIKSFVLNGRAFHLHATKGWRSYRAA